MFLQVDVFDFGEGEDLCTGSYIETAMPIVSRLVRASPPRPTNLYTIQIDMQIAKQGRRLAAWLDTVFECAQGLSVPHGPWP